MKRGTPGHPKTQALADSLGVCLHSAVGILEMLWHYAGTYTPRGDIGKVTNQALAKAVDWRESPDALVQALLLTGWIDSSEEHRFVIHDWHQHVEEAVKKKLARSKESFVTERSPNAPVPVIYFLRAGENGNIKIGFTEGRMNTRLEVLQTGCPEKLVVLGVIKGNRSDEAALHRQFSEGHVNGEWFRPTSDLMEYIGSRCLPLSALTSPRGGRSSPSRVAMAEAMAEASGTGQCSAKRFEEFWAVYWRKVAKTAAEKVYAKIITTEADHAAVLEAVERQSAAMLSREPEKRPHATTWLNQKRWQDEYDPPIVNGHEEAFFEGHMNPGLRD